MVDRNSHKCVLECMIDWFYQIVMVKLAADRYKYEHA